MINVVENFRRKMRVKNYSKNTIELYSNVVYNFIKKPNENQTT